jgi:hypothetical protein
MLLLVKQHEVEQMSNVVELDAKRANCAWAAVVDAERRNDNMRYTYNAAQQNVAKRVEYMLGLAYEFTATYTNFRKKFIAIKIADYSVKNQQYAEMLDEIIVEREYQKVITPQGLVIRIPR